MRTNKEILNSIYNRRESLLEKLKQLKNSKNCDETAIKQTDAIIEELNSIIDYIENS